MADETKKKILKTIGEAAAIVSPGAKLAKTLAELRNKEKKADFQKGDYSDIKTDKKKNKYEDKVKDDTSISDEKLKKLLEKERIQRQADSQVNAVSLSELEGAKPGIDKPTGKIQAFKSGGRVNFKGGGCTTKGMNKKAYGKNS